VTAAHQTADTLHAEMLELGKAARDAAAVLALAPTNIKNAALRAAAAALRADLRTILAANDRDVAAAEARGTAKPLVDRLKLDDSGSKPSRAGWKTWPTCPIPSAP
jgi:glutamate-5-semialdehyde dehydrogenase